MPPKRKKERPDQGSGPLAHGFKGVAIHEIKQCVQTVIWIVVEELRGLLLDSSCFSDSVGFLSDMGVNLNLHSEIVGYVAYALFLRLMPVRFLEPRPSLLPFPNLPAPTFGCPICAGASICDNSTSASAQCGGRGESACEGAGL